ncbi:GNAT family N-acetyltransferase [Nakamurella deserti]|uniref:GNAT family N-acetyltransferase n=1 Tax=Nakamurella deserti TaxID=2164074 RepID=UPI001F0C1DB4|nr:GNAT family N-acetyltransferase [Nakamurella deserti]
MLDLERIAARGWRGTGTATLGDWLLRAGGGFTGRANSVLVLGSPGVALPAAMARVEAFYGEHGLPPMFQIPFVPERTDDEPIRTSRALQSAGWRAFNETTVLVASLKAAQRSFPGSDLGEFRHAAEPSAEWLAGYLYRGRLRPPGRPLPAAAVAVLTNADGPDFVSLHADGEQLGVARGVLVDDWLGVTAVTVAERHRRRGVGTALMAELVRWAADRGATHAYLQADAANTAALKMYRRGGFKEHHRYHYLSYAD